MSAIWSLQEAMDNAFQSDATLAPMLGGDRVYSLLGPQEDVPYAYIVLSNSAESNWPMFGTPGFSGTETLSIWSPKLTKEEVAAIAKEVVRILSLPLTLDNINFVTGEPTIILLGLDPDQKYSRAVITYEVMSHG